MRIAQIAPTIERVPPKTYGGTERVVSALTEELVRRGHDVTLFASADSVTAARLYPLCPLPLREAKIGKLYGANIPRLQHVSTPYQYQNEFDIIHDHNEPMSVPIAHFSQVPVVVTLHGVFNQDKQHLFEEFTNPYVVSISKAQLSHPARLNHIGTVYHGFDMQTYPFSEKHDGYLLYVGRISPQKGLHNAIALAEKLDRQLIIAAKLDERDMAYFEEKIKSHLSEKILWVGEVDEDERNQLMARALCFLHPVEWDEPFGLTLIEAMACGAPVIAYRRGSIPEIVAHGKTGFVVNSVNKMAEAVSKLEMIDRKACRRYALTKFTIERMTDDYEIVYEAILAGKYSSYRKSSRPTFGRPLLQKKENSYL